MKVDKIKEFKIDNGICFKCGNTFNDKEDKTMHHSIPQSMSPEFNVLIPLCRKCHREINKLLVSQIPKVRPSPQLSTFSNRLEGLKGSLIRYQTKLDKVMNEVNKQIKVKEKQVTELKKEIKENEDD